MNSINEIDEDDSMLYASFNQDNSFFSVGTERGFKIYQTFPFRDHYERIMNGGIGVVEMLYKSNFLALMGGGRVPKYGKNKLIIWDDHENKVISELKFTTTIMNVKLKKDLLIVVCQKRIYIFDFDTFEIKDTIDTGDNKNELIALNGDPEYTIIAYPSIKSINKISLKNYKEKTIIHFTAQEDSVSKICMNYNGTLIASTNDNGTIIRIHSGNDGAFLQEFKRGHEKVKINYICFDNDSKLMAVSSSKGTIHIFSMGSTIKKLKEHKKKKEAEKKEKEKIENKKENDENKQEEEKIKNLEDEQKEKSVNTKKEEKKEKDENEIIMEKEEEKDKKEIIEKESNGHINEEGKENIMIENENEKEKNKKEMKEKEEQIEKDNNINNNNINNFEENENNEKSDEEELPKNSKSFFGGIFGSQTEKSFARVRLKSQDSICAFASNNILVIISSDNKYYQAQIDIKKGGDCKIIYEENLMKKPFNYVII